MSGFVLWMFALMSSVVIIHYIPGPLGGWLSLVTFVAAFDYTHGVSWKPWWRTVSRGVASLAVCFLLASRSAPVVATVWAGVAVLVAYHIHRTIREMSQNRTGA
jgi:hypothetical protein